MFLICGIIFLSLADLSDQIKGVELQLNFQESNNSKKQKSTTELLKLAHLIF